MGLLCDPGVGGALPCLVPHIQTGVCVHDGGGVAGKVSKGNIRDT